MTGPLPEQMKLFDDTTPLLLQVFSAVSAAILRKQLAPTIAYTTSPELFCVIQPQHEQIIWCLPEQITWFHYTP